MSTTSTTSTTSFAAIGWATPVAPEKAAAIADWLDACERDAVHPGSIDSQLRRQGWSPAHATAVAEQYRQRFDEHSLGYTGLLVATGLAALAAGTAGHLMTAGVDGPVNRNALAVWLTIFMCAAPFAAWSHWWAATVDRDDPAAVWSRPRRGLARILLWGAGIVGIGRLITYAARLIGALVGATWAQGNSAAAGALNVAITIAIALPLGLWAFGFLHRFDTEDPTSPLAHRRPRATRSTPQSTPQSTLSL